MPCGEIVRRLEVVRPEHDDHDVQRRVDLDSLLQPGEPVPSWLEGIVPGRAPAVQAILDDAHPPARGHEGGFKNARPALGEPETPARVRDDAPGERVAVDEDLLHGVPQPTSQRTKTSAKRRSPAIATTATPGAAPASQQRSTAPKAPALPIAARATIGRWITAWLASQAYEPPKRRTNHTTIAL